MVLSAEDVERAQMNFGTERCDGLDKHTCLNGHVQRAIDVHALERLLPEICAACHKARHLVLGRNKLRCDDWPLLRIAFTRPGCLRSVICQAGNLHPAEDGTLLNSECRKFLIC